MSNQTERPTESTKVADLKRQLAAEREGRMLAERIVDEVRARNRELEQQIAALSK